MIALGADHGGVQIKDAVKQYLKEERDCLSRFWHLQR